MRPLNNQDNFAAIAICARALHPHPRPIHIQEMRWGVGTFIFERQMVFINSAKGKAALQKAGINVAMKSVIPPTITGDQPE